MLFLFMVYYQKGNFIHWNKKLLIKLLELMEKSFSLMSIPWKRVFSIHVRSQYFLIILLLNLVLISDTKLLEIENTLSLTTEIGFIVFMASNNKSQFSVLLMVTSNTENSVFSVFGFDIFSSGSYRNLH